MPIGSVGVAGIDGEWAKLPVVVLAVSKEEMTLRGLGGEIGRSGAPAGMLDAAVAAVAARTTTAKWVTKSIVLVARVCVSKPVIYPREQGKDVHC